MGCFSTIIPCLVLVSWRRMLTDRQASLWTCLDGSTQELVPKVVLLSLVSKCWAVHWIWSERPLVRLFWKTSKVGWNVYTTIWTVSGKKARWASTNLRFFFCGKTFAASLRGNSSFGATQIASGQWAPSRVLRLCQRVPYELPTSSP